MEILRRNWTMKKIIIITLSLLISVSGICQEPEIKTQRATLNYDGDKGLIQKNYKLANNQRTDEAFASEGWASGTASGNVITTEFLLTRFNNASVNESINLFAYKMAFWFTSWFGGAVMLLSIFLNFYNNIIKGKINFDWGKLVRDFVLYACLNLYVPVFGFVSWLGDGFPWMVMSIGNETLADNTFTQFQFMVNDPTNGLYADERKNVLDVAKSYKDGTDATMNKAILLAMQEKILDAEIKEGVETQDSGWGMLSYLKRIYTLIINSPMNALLGSLIILASIGKAVIFGLCVAMEKFYFIIGPLAILFSFIKIFKDKWITWLTRWIMLKCVMGSIIIIDYVILLFQNSAALEGIYGTNYSSPEYTLFISLIAITMYVMSFYLTSAYIGSPDTGKFLSVAAGIAMKAVSGMMGAGGGGGGGGSLGGGGGKLSEAGSNIAWQSMENPDNVNR
jgi:hypothetical protein